MIKTIVRLPVLSETCQQCSKSRQLGKNFTTASIKVLTPCDTHDQIIFTHSLSELRIWVENLSPLNVSLISCECRYYQRTGNQRRRHNINYRQVEKRILDEILGRSVYDTRLRPPGQNMSMEGGSTLVYVNIFVREERMPHVRHSDTCQSSDSECHVSCLRLWLFEASISMLSRDFSAISDVGMVWEN